MKGARGVKDSIKLRYSFLLFIFFSSSFWSFKGESDDSCTEALSTDIHYKVAKNDAISICGWALPKDISCGHSLILVPGAPISLAKAIEVCAAETDQAISAGLFHNILPRGVKSFEDALRINVLYSPDEISMGHSIFTSYNLKSLRTSIAIAALYSEDEMVANLLVPCALSRLGTKQGPELVTAGPFTWEDYNKSNESCLEDYGEDFEGVLSDLSD